MLLSGTRVWQKCTPTTFLTMNRKLAEVFRFVSSRLLIHRRSQLAPSFHGFQHGDLIGILNIAAGGNAGCNARDFKPGSPQLS